MRASNFVVSAFLIGAPLLFLLLQYGQKPAYIGILSVLSLVCSLSFFYMVRANYKLAQFNTIKFAFFLVLVVNIVDLFSPVKLGGLAELFVFIYVLLNFNRILAAITSSRVLVFILSLFFLAIMIAILSSLFSGWSNTKGAIYQAAYNLKWPLMILAGLAYSQPDQKFSWLNSGIFTYIVIVSLAVIIEIFVPGVYESFARNLLEFNHTPNPLTGGLSMRGTGPFVHSSVLAYFSGLFFCILFTRMLIVGNVSFKWLICLVVLLLFVLHSGQQQELSAMMVCCALIASLNAFSRPVVGIAVSTAGLLIVGLGITLVLGQEQLYKLADEWGFGGGYGVITSARPVLFLDSIVVANENFPLGSGLGTFAGIGAKNFNRDLYESLGYGFFWWYQQDIFLLDTYWPNFIAEFGWLGFSLLALIPLSLIFSCYLRWIRETDLDVRAWWCFAFVGQFFTLIISLTSPIYSDPGMVLFSFMLYGVAVTVSANKKGRAT